eukprot:Skav200340  [mRNA]  locus=scaffold26:86787:90800:- [translate_table: standard]
MLTARGELVNGNLHLIPLALQYGIMGGVPCCSLYQPLCVLLSNQRKQGGERAAKFFSAKPFEQRSIWKRQRYTGAGARRQLPLEVLPPWMADKEIENQPASEVPAASPAPGEGGASAEGQAESKAEPADGSTCAGSGAESLEVIGWWWLWS